MPTRRQLNKRYSVKQVREPSRYVSERERYSRGSSRYKSQHRSLRHASTGSAYLDFILALDKRVLIAAIVIIVLLLWLAIDSISFAGKCYAGVKIGNVDVSGLNKTEARDKLVGEYDKNLYGKTVYIFTEQEAYDKVDLVDYFSQQDQIAEQISTLEEASDAHIFQTNAADVGAYYNYDGAIEAALKPGHNLNIFTRLGSRLFGTHFDLEIETGDGLDALYSKVANATGEPHVDFNIEVNDGQVNIVSGHAGKAVNREKFSQGLSDTLSINSTEAQKVLFSVEDDPVIIDEAKATEAKTRVEAAIEAGANFKFDEIEFMASKSDLGDWISTSVNKEAETLDVDFDTNKAKQGISKLTSNSIGVSDTSVSISKSDSGDLVVNPDGEVRVPDLQGATEKLRQNKLASPRLDDVIDIDISEQKDNFSFDQALEVGLITQISSYTTEFTNTSSTANRNHNIGLVSDTISNTIVSKDNGSFSFNNTSGPTDAEHGYLDAGTQVEGEIVQEAGGGICQVATTVFNAVYEGGFPVTERHPHSLRNLSYPAGRDAAVYVGDDEYSLDLIWENDSTSDVVLKSWHDETSVTVAIYGSMAPRVVESIEGDFEEGEKHSTVFKEDDSLAKGEYNTKTVGTDGSQISVRRKVYDRSGNLLHDDNFVSVYSKVDEVIAVGPGTDTSQIKKS